MTETSTGSAPRTGAWLLTAGRQGARLLCAEPTPHGRLHVDLRARLAEDWAGAQHGRPSPRTSKDGHSYASEGHESDERIHRFAKAVGAWLEQELARHAVDRLHAFAAPRLLGELRKVLPARLADRVTEHALDLEPLSPAELAKHDAVASACAGDGHGAR